MHFHSCLFLPLGDHFLEIDRERTVRVPLRRRLAKGFQQGVRLWKGFVRGFLEGSRSY